MTLHTYNPQPMSLPSINFLHLKVSEIWPRQNFIDQGHYGKIKGQIKVTHDVAHLQPPTNVPTKYQLPTPYGCHDIVRTRFYRSRSLRKGQRLNQGHTMTLQTYGPPTNVPTKYQLLTPYSFRSIARTRFYRSRSLRKGQRLNQGHTMTLQTYGPPTNIPTKYQLLTPYSFRDIARTRFYRSRSLQKGQIKVTP